MMKRIDYLKEAEKIVCHDRENTYGKPENNFTTIADLWNAYLVTACDVETNITAKDVAIMMMLLKIARIANGKFKPDNWVDLIGYAACGAECADSIAFLDKKTTVLAAAENMLSEE